MQQIPPSRPKRAGNTIPAVSFLLRLLVVLSFSLAPLAGEAEARMGERGHSLEGWVAICGDGGIRYIRIGETGGETPESDDCTCTVCTCCLTACSGFAGMQPPGTSVEAFVSISRQIITFKPDAIAVAPEQYWAASRGPPDIKEEESMTTTHARNAAQTACLAAGGGRIPCF